MKSTSFLSFSLPLIAALSLPACSSPKTDLGSPDASALAKPNPRIVALIQAENTRSSILVTDDDLANSDRFVRRAAVRALARILDANSRDRLLFALSDDDPEVLSWAAYGLGQLCEGHGDQLTKALVVRSASLQSETLPPTARLDPLFALSRALGACAGPFAEKSLVSSLNASASAPALALGDLASHNKRLEEESAAALLKLAAGDATHEPLTEALYPFSRLKNPPPRAVDRLAEVARERLAKASPARLFAIRSIARTGDAAASDLENLVAASSNVSPEERAEAARSLAKIPGKSGQEAILRAIDKLSPAPDPVALTALVGPGFGPLTTCLEVLDASSQTSKSPTLRAMASLPIVPSAPASLARRIVRLRCEAARLLAVDQVSEALLSACDPDANGSRGALARLAVLNKSKIQADRLALLKSYLEPSWPPRIQEEALRVAGAHPEIADLSSILALALASTAPGVVAVAAEQVSGHPSRFFELAPDSPKKSSRKTKTEAVPALAKVDTTISKALLDALSRDFGPDAVETTIELVKAVGSLRLAQAKDRIQSFCSHSISELRKEASSALQAIDNKSALCDPAQITLPKAAEEIDHLTAAPIKLQFKTDVGTLILTLDPYFAPVSVTRFVDLAQKGFFDKMPIHRVVPGFVMQFGDKGGDSYGGAGKQALRCETSPIPFETGVVAVALSGRDTGSSQLFITLSPSPHLDGHYAVIGKAEGPLSTIAEGDIIEKVSVIP